MINKRILITGGAGSIGSELTRLLASSNQIYILDINETALFELYEELRLDNIPIQCRTGDIRNLYTVGNVFANFEPEIVFHLAALKHVVPAEHTPREYIETNEIGTCNIVEAAKRFNVEKFIFTSSDKAVVANQIYGRTKAIGELIVKNAGYIVVRFGNVIASQGSVLPIWEKQLKEGKPLTLTDKGMERYWMSISEACHLLIEAAEMGEAGMIMVMDMGEPQNLEMIMKKILIELGKPEYPVKIIGKRPGESLREEIMTTKEKEQAIKQGHFYVIR